MKRRRNYRPFSPRWWLGAPLAEDESPTRWQTVLVLVFVVIVALSCGRYAGWL